MRTQKVTSTVFAGFALLITLSDAHAELRQFSCELDNDYVAFVLREVADMGTVGARSYIVDLQARGPTLRLPPEYYAPDWHDVEDIEFRPINVDVGYGKLSFRIRQSSHSFTQPIGIVQRACWNAAQQFIARKGIVVHETEPGAQ